jgi:hypothetical protein
MKIARLVGVMLVAVLAMSLVAASASSAAPTFKPGSGNLTAKGGTSVLKASSDTVTCATNEAAGAIASSSLVGPFTIKFTGCSSSGATKSGCTIKNVGGTEGTIVTSTVHGVLGTVLNPTGGAAGLLILPTSGKQFVTLAENSCTPETKVTGSVAGIVLPTGKSQTTGKLVLTVISSKQQITSIDTAGGNVEPALTAFSEPATQSTEDSITFSAAVEVT